MPPLPKAHFNNTTVFVTTSVEQGIMFPANPLMEAIIYSCLARAQTLHPVKIDAVEVEGTHVHMILTVADPNDVKGFIERFKTESAHAINRLLGRKKRTVWCDGYDSPILASPAEVIRELVYLYGNPAKDGLEDSIRNYPGVSTWKAFQACLKTGKKKHTTSHEWIHRNRIPCLRGVPLGFKDFRRIARRLKDEAPEENELTIEPNAWMESFGIKDEARQREYNEQIVKDLKAFEKKHRLKRREEGRGVMGAKRLREQTIDPDYEPKRRDGRRSWVICSDIELRVIIIEMIKALVAKAREVYERWKMGDYSVAYPLGLYPPARPKVVEPLSLRDAVTYLGEV